MMSPAQRDHRLGTKLGGKYELRSVLGRGGMGVVFEAVQEWTGRPVAVKVLHERYREDDAALQRLIREAQSAASLRHEHVVDVIDMGRADDGTFYLVQELLEGETLEQRLRVGGPMAPDDVLELLLPIVDALDAAHDVGVVHRDVKPANIFLSQGRRGATVPKLLDFGIAKVAEEATSGNLTTTGVVVGTPAYMSPEQVRAEGTVGPGTDIWAMGVVLFECLTGRLPYDAQAATALFAAILHDPPARVLDITGDAPPSLARAIDGCLEPELAARHPSMAALAEALEAVRGELTGARPMAASHRTPAPETTRTSVARDPSRRDAESSGERYPAGDRIRRSRQPAQPVAPASAESNGVAARTSLAERPAEGDAPKPPPHRARRAVGMVTAVLLMVGGAVAVSPWPRSHEETSGPGTEHVPAKGARVGGSATGPGEAPKTVPVDVDGATTLKLPAVEPERVRGTSKQRRSANDDRVSTSDENGPPSPDAATEPEPREPERAVAGAARDPEPLGAPVLPAKIDTRPRALRGNRAASDEKAWTTGTDDTAVLPSQ